MNKLINIFSLSILAFSFVTLSAQTSSISEETNREELLRLSKKWSAEQEAQMILATEKAKELGLEIRQVFEDGTIIELQGIDERGQLIYYKTGNADAARTISADKLYPGGSLGLSINGSSMTAGEWDGGAVRLSHQELVNRVTQVDSSTSYANHATHVAGTIMASGVDTNARGMAYAADLDAYDWTNDDAEMAAAAANGLLISNHSYGNITGWYYNGTNYQWWGDTTLSSNQDYKFGFYNSQSQAWDQIARNAPFYLIVKSAGNDRGDSGSATHYLPLHSAWSTTPRNADGGPQGYDCISTYSGAKNILTVGAVNAIPGGYSSPTSVVMSSFSGWGPTDDGRIKPDVVANGVGVYSSLATNDSAYASWNGTSMATPSTTGALLLLQEHYYDVNTAYMKSATLKALAIHTADEAGAANGPDYKHGWGLLNIERAAEHISDSSGTKAITETSISNSSNYSFSITVNGFSPIRATIAWTDVPGTPVSAALNPTTAMLVNDLDIRIIRDSDSTVYFPYILNPSSPSTAASNGDNVRDNVEQIYLASPSSGSYTVIVSHKGTLSGGSSQDFSLILDGGIPPAQPLNCLGIVTAPAYWNFDTLINCSSTSGSACVLPTWYGWRNDTLDNIDWTVRNNTTPSSGTGPSNDYNTGTSTGKYLYTEASTSGTGFPNKQAILYSPCIDLDTLTNSELAFAYHMYGSTMGSMSVEIFNGYSWTQVWSETGNQDTSWQEAAVDISNYDGDTVVIRFIGVTGSNYQSDMAIDAIQIREFESCPGPSNFSVYNITDTTAIFSWSSNASFWKIRLDIKDSITVIPPTTINFNPVLFSNLIPNTTYDIYLQDSCGVNDTSAWYGPITFTTSGPLQNPTPCGLGASIPDNTCPSLAYLPFEVTYSGNQMGVNAFLKEAKVIISHSYDGDIQFGITSPAGDTVMLSMFNGGSGDHYGNPSDTGCSQTTTFSMSATTAISFGTPPFIGNYLPQGNFSDFNSGNPNGTWKFIICDGASGDIGSLEYVELVFDSVQSTSCLFQNISVSADGIDTICLKDTTTLFPIYGNQMQGNYTFQWYKDGQLLTGDTSYFYDAFAPGSYNVIVTDSNNCSDSAATGLYITVLNPPIVSIFNSVSDSICLGDTAQLMTIFGINYQWYKNGAAIFGAKSQTFNVSDSARYNVVVTDTNYCRDSSSTGLDISVFDVPIVSISNSGTSTFCSGDNRVLSASVGNFYQWYKNGVSLPGSIYDTLIVTSEGSYNVLISNGTNCEDSAINSIQITVLQGPVVDSISNTGPSSFCEDDSTTLSMNAVGSSYQWYNNGNIISGATNSTLSVNYSGMFNVLVTDSNSCSDSASFPKILNALTVPSVFMNATSSTTICSGDTVRIEASGGNTADWYRDGQIISGWSSTPSYSYYTASLPGRYNVIIFETSNSICFDSSSTGIIVTVNQSPVVTISSNSSPNFCFGDSTRLSTISGVSYQWYKDGNVISGATDSTFLALDSGLYNVVVTNVSNCSDSAQTPFAVNAYSLPSPAISTSGPTTFCSKDSLILTASGGNSYQWYNNGQLISGATNNVYSVTADGNYNVYVGLNNLCFDSASAAVSATINSSPSVSISSTTIPAFCYGDSTTLTTISASSYQWYKDGNMISGAMDSTYLVLDSGQYNVIVTNSNNCSDSSSQPYTVQVYSLPDVSISAIGDTVFCEGDSVTLSTAILGAQYQWYQNGQLLIGEVFSNLQAKFIGSYNVLVTNGNNCSDSARNGKVVTVNGLPIVGISASDSSICIGDTAILTATPGFSYAWRRNGFPIAGGFGQSIDVSQAGSYNVVATNTNFCSDTAFAPIVITEFDLPIVSLDAQPELCNTQGPTLLLGGQPLGGVYSGNTVTETSGQYFFDPNTAGTGAFDITYTFTDNNACSESDVEQLTVVNCVGIEDVGNASDLIFYPNPTKGILNISVPENLSGPVTIRVFDISGQIVLNQIIETEAISRILEVDLSNQVNGAYFIQLHTTDKIYRQKVILEKNF